MQLYFWRPRRAHDGVLAVERVDREHRLCADRDGELVDLSGRADEEKGRARSGDGLGGGGGDVLAVNVGGVHLA